MMTDLSIPDIVRAPGMTTQEYVYLRLRNAVMAGALTPGTALTIRGLARALELSQTPIREALRRLSSENAVEVLGNRRLKVPKMTVGKFDELALLRVALETHAAQRSLPYISDIFIENLVRVDDEMDQCLALGNLDELTRLNFAFHTRLYALNPNQAVVPLIESVWLQLGPFQRQVIRNLDKHYVIDRHKEILDALRHRDLDALTSAVESDICDGIVHAGRALLRQSQDSDSGKSGSSASPVERSVHDRRVDALRETARTVVPGDSP